MFYHFLAPEGGNLTREENSTEKIYHTSNIINKSNEMLLQKVQQRHTRLINTIYFRSFFIDQSWNTLQLKNIVLSFHPPFEPITAFFTITGLWPKGRTTYCCYHDLALNVTVIRFRRDLDLPLI